MNSSVSVFAYVVVVVSGVFIFGFRVKYIVFMFCIDVFVFFSVCCVSLIMMFWWCFVVFCGRNFVFGGVMYVFCGFVRIVLFVCVMLMEILFVLFLNLIVSVVDDVVDVVGVVCVDVVLGIVMMCGGV